ncbi:MAG: hypothetical protein AAF688_15515, partial [Bacteroidota bacterium]
FLSTCCLVNNSQKILLMFTSDNFIEFYFSLMTYNGSAKRSWQLLLPTAVLAIVRCCLLYFIVVLV